MRRTLLALLPFALLGLVLGMFVLPDVGAPSSPRAPQPVTAHGQGSMQSGQLDAAEEGLERRLLSPARRVESRELRRLGISLAQFTFVRPTAFGAVVTGKVVDSSGRPLSDVEVSVRAQVDTPPPQTRISFPWHRILGQPGQTVNPPNSDQPEKDFFELVREAREKEFRQNMNVSPAQMQTDDLGQYEFTVRGPGTWKLEFNHTEYVAHTLADQELDPDQSTELPTVVLRRGAGISGTVLIGSAPANQVTVVVEALPPAHPGVIARAVSDEGGAYVLPRRLLPGEYQIHATRSPEDPVMSAVDLESTRQVFWVLQGQESLQLDMWLPRR